MNAESADPDAPDRLLALVWRYHRQWSLAGEAAKGRLDRWRERNLALLVIGALAGAAAAQTWLPPDATRWCAILAALALALAGFIQANALDADRAARWIRARAAAEALKAEVFRYLLRVAPYADADRCSVLNAQLAVVQDRANTQLLEQQSAPTDDRPLPALRTVGEYVTGRAKEQADWHRRRSGDHVRRGRRLRTWQLVVTGVGALLSALAGFLESWHLSTWTAAATTVAATIGTQVAAAQHQRIAQAYAATVDQLDRLVARFEVATATPEQGAQFVVDVERVLAAQNSGWSDLLTTTKPVNQDRPPALESDPSAAD
jgi:hypothetical protein